MRRWLDASQLIDGRTTVGDQDTKVKQNRRFKEGAP